ncbi:MAG: hypothetical protein Q9N26_07715 [Aquificota bacterium]|nr:hypothetical protein [Aquificota bacterium]
MGQALKDKLRTVKERLLDPFDTEGLERDFEELLDLFRSARPEERVSVREEFEEIKELLERNLSIISGSLEPIIKRGNVFSRRV